MFDTLSALVRIQEICDEFNTGCYKIDKLCSHICEWGLQSIEHAFQEEFLGKNTLKKISNLFHAPFHSEGRIEEDSFQ